MRSQQRKGPKGGCSSTRRERHAAAEETHRLTHPRTLHTVNTSHARFRLRAAENDPPPPLAAAGMAKVVDLGVLQKKHLEPVQETEN